MPLEQSPHPSTCWVTPVKGVNVSQNIESEEVVTLIEENVLYLSYNVVIWAYRVRTNRSGLNEPGHWDLE